MRPLFSAQGMAMLRRFAARRRMLLALDFDGTLAPITKRPESARLPPRARRLLSLAARRYPTVILSGRARADVLGLLRGVTGLDVIGNHGAEWSATGTAAELTRWRVAAWREVLSGSLQGIDGLQIEDKGLSLSVHVRRCADPRRAAELTRSAAAGLRGARLVGGKAVLNLVPEDAADKGQALLGFMRKARCSHAIFVGDDVTDEDVFEIQGLRRSILGVRVGRSQHSAAHFYLDSRDQVDRLLRRLAGGQVSDLQ